MPPFIAPPDYKPVYPGLTATAAGTQANSILLRFGTNIFTTVAGINDSATCPTSTGSGRPIVISNLGANQMQVFPEPGGRFDNQAVDNPIQLIAGIGCILVDTAPGRWAKMRSN